jgi:hypothetical protein
MSKDVHLKTLRNIRRQATTDEPDVGGVEVNVGGDQAEVNHSRNRLMKAVRLGPKSSKRGHTRTHAVSGRDEDQRSRRYIGAGPKSREEGSSHQKTGPNSYTSEDTFSSVKVASVAKDERRKVRNIKADRSTAANYRHIISAPPTLIDVPIDDLPMRPFPPNDGEEVARELAIIIDAQETAPLTDDVMDLADEEPLELFKRACHALQVPVDNETVGLLVQDLRRIALTLKYVHLRPRPSEIAPYHGRVVVLESPDPYDDTPSYPSVHATIGYGLANMYAGMYPHHAEDFYQVGDTIALQRVQSGRHYPSDNEYAKMLADLILG